VSSFKRTAALWVLRQAALRASESVARRRQAWTDAGAGSTATGTGRSGAGTAGGGTGWPGSSTTGSAGTGSAGSTGTTGTGFTGSTSAPAGERPGWAHSAGPRLAGVQPRVEELVRRAWPLLDTPANRRRAARFVERMRAVADSRR
jgi:hypothetical protein